jgi:hypothetical protein
MFSTSVLWHAKIDFPDYQEIRKLVIIGVNGGKVECQKEGKRTNAPAVPTVDGRATHS